MKNTQDSEWYVKVAALGVMDTLVMTQLEGANQRAATRLSPLQPTSLMQLCQANGIKDGVRESVRGSGGVAGKYGTYWAMLEGINEALKRVYPDLDTSQYSVMVAKALGIGVLDSAATTPFDYIRARQQSCRPIGSAPISFRQAGTELLTDPAAYRSVFDAMKMRVSQCALASLVVIAMQESIKAYAKYCDGQKIDGELQQRQMLQPQQSASHTDKISQQPTESRGR